MLMGHINLKVQQQMCQSESNPFINRIRNLNPKMTCVLYGLHDMTHAIYLINKFRSD